MSDPLPREIRCVLVPVGNLRLLLPNTNIAEVITMSAPQPLVGAPRWLLGRIEWRGFRVPLVSFTELAGTEPVDAELSVRVAVLKALGGNPKLPFITVLTQGFPRLTTLNSELIIPTHDGKPLPPGVRAHVLVRDDVAMIPDLEWIEATLLELYDDGGVMASTESHAADAADAADTADAADVTDESYAADESDHTEE